MLFTRWVWLETAVPPVFGKEVTMKKLVPAPVSLLMKALLILMLLFTAPLLFSQDTPFPAADTDTSATLRIRINDNSDTLTAAEIHREGIRIGTAGTERESAPEVRPGVPLSLHLPLFIDIWEFTLTDRDGAVHAIPAGEAADNLFEMYLLPSGDGFDFHYGAISVPDILEITIAGDPLPGKPLDVWISWEGTDELKAIIGEFSRHFNIPVTVNTIPNTATKLMAHNRGNMNIPDVVMIKSDYIPQLLSEQALQPLGWDLPESFQEQGIASFFSGQLYGAPFYSDVQILCYNPEIIPSVFGEGTAEENGTLRDLEQALASVDESFIPATWNLYSAYWLFPFQLGFGKEHIINGDGSITINDDATVAAVGYLMDLIDRELIVPVERDGMISQFIQGQAGMILTGSYSIPAFTDLGIPFAYTVYPLNQETGRYVSPLIDYKGFAIPKRSRNPVGARRLVQYLSSQQAQAAFSFANFKNPVRNDAWSLSKLPEHTEWVLRESIVRGTIIPPDPAYSIAKDTLWKIVRMILGRQLPVAEGLDKAQEIITNNLSRVQGKGE